MLGEKYVGRTRLSVLKVAAGQCFRLQLLRDEPLGYIVHWIGRAGYLCCGENCPACLAATGARWVGLMPCRLLGHDGSRRTVLLEFTGEAWARLDGLLRLEEPIERVGCVIEITRARARTGLVAVPVPEASVSRVPQLHDSILVDALATLFGLGRCLPTMNAEDWSLCVQESVQAKLQRALAMSNN